MAKLRYPGVEVVIAKKDIAGAFRLLWVAPKDVHLFAGDMPWREDKMVDDEEGPFEGTLDEDLTVLYLVSSFGFSGSPGEWTMWGRATEEYHRAHAPSQSRRDGAAGFDCKILVDDAILVEPVLGLRPWVSAHCYEQGVKLTLGPEAINAEKDALEGEFKEEQVIWGLTMNTRTEQASLPSRRIEKGAYLLAEPSFDEGQRSLTLRQLQQFRGITTGWAVVVKGLKHELKAADVFLTSGDGALPVRPRDLGYHNEGDAEQRAWEDLWSLFEVCRWLCARPEIWESQFCSTLRDLLDPKERLGLPDGHRQAVFVSADATPTVMGAIDWTGGFAMRLEFDQVGPWLKAAMEGEYEEEGLRIHLSELLALVALVSGRREGWSGRIIIYAGDNTTVRDWIRKRQSRSRGGRLLLRALAMYEMRYDFTLLAGWWRTYHNIDSDFVTRCTEDEFEDYVARKGWTRIHVAATMEQAIEDTRRFGPCFLAWEDPEDRRLVMQLKERRVQRAVDRPLKIQWSKLWLQEWTAVGRAVKDFEKVADSCGVGTDGEIGLVVGTVGCDLKGKQISHFLKQLHQGDFSWGLLEGPTRANWGLVGKWAAEHGWSAVDFNFLTTELGEALARSRTGYVLHAGALSQMEVDEMLQRTVVATPLGAVLKHGTLHEGLVWDYPTKFELTFGAPREPLLPHVVGHAWDEQGTRRNVHGLTGPGRWPLQTDGGVHYEKLEVYDRGAPAGALRPLAYEEIWMAQGRTMDEWRTTVERCDGDRRRAYDEGCRATGLHSAESLLTMVAALAVDDGRHQRQAGAVRDGEEDQSLVKLLLWLKKWKHGEFGPEGKTRKAGGNLRSLVSRYGEALWLEALDDLEALLWDDRRAGGRRTKRSATQAQGEACLVNIPEGIRFDGNVTEKVDEWLEANLQGDKAESTARAYADMWQKWKAWAASQQWESEFLDPRGDRLEKENKLLAFLGYLGWLDFSAASLKQAVFAVKDAHKRAGAGDPTEGLFRVWLLMNALDRRAARKPRRLGVTPGMLRWIGRQFEAMPQRFGEAKVDATMIQSALLVAWFFMMRASEYSDSNGLNRDMMLRGIDLKLSRDGAEAGLGQATEVTVQFRRTKADQEAFGTCKTLAKTGEKFLCPVAALEEYRCTVPGGFKGPDAMNPLFRWGNGAILKRTEVQFLLQKAATAEGLPADRFLSHSLRIGGASALYQASADIELVKRMGRWSSSAVQRYLHDGGHVLKDLSAKMSKVDQRIHYT